MTIAACHVSPEGVVLGADSTTSIVSVADGGHQAALDYAQKLFEVGPVGASVGLVTWGMGQIGTVSHRTIAAQLGVSNDAGKFGTMEEVADGLATLLWDYYLEAYADDLAWCRDVVEDFPELPEEERKRFQTLGRNLSGGYCVAGRLTLGDRCEAYTVRWFPWYQGPKVERQREEQALFWGQPDIMTRLTYGWDPGRVEAILNSGFWTGTPEDLINVIVGRPELRPQHLPIREAVDWIHTVIHTTIRGIKFALKPHTCGGPVEIAMITTDRPFRWVLHKGLDAATVAAPLRRVT